MKKTAIIIGVLAIICIAAASLILIIGGRDISSPETSDLRPDRHSVPEEQNAFPHLMTAADAIHLPPDFKILIDYIEGKSIYDSLITDILQKNDPAFPLIAKALAFDRCQVPEGADPAYIAQWYKITLLLGVRTVHDLRAGQFDPAVTSAVSLLHFGDILQYDIRNLMDISPSIKILQLGLNQAGDIARAESVPKADLQRLADALAALRPLEHGFQRAFRFKYQKVADQIDGFRASKKTIVQTFPDTELMPFFIRKTTWFPGYMFKENETKQAVAKLYRDTVQNLANNYSDMDLYDIAEYFGLGKQSLWWYYSRPNLVGRIFYAFTTPEIDTYLEGKCQMEGSTRATRLIVALRIYEKDHGRLPDQLSALCPDYLKSVPIDPFDGKPFRYAPEKAIVYSVSKDLKDSGGSMTVPPDEIYGPDYPKTWIAEDGVFKIKP